MQSDKKRREQSLLVSTFILVHFSKRKKETMSTTTTTTSSSSRRRRDPANVYHWPSTLNAKEQFEVNLRLLASLGPEKYKAAKQMMKERTELDLLYKLQAQEEEEEEEVKEEEQEEEEEVKEEQKDNEGCFCGENFEEFQIACKGTNCDQWFHPACIGITEQEAKQEGTKDYFCPECNPAPPPKRKRGRPRKYE